MLDCAYGVESCDNQGFLRESMAECYGLNCGSLAKCVGSAGCNIGVNATLLLGTTIGKHAMVGAGAVVTKDVSDYAVVVGNPAKVIRELERD
ncbi:hypothetical protein KAM380_058130 [Aeromonas caviae]|mgnify:CR=1 FL=1|nr:hypothetical protein KAM380_058130 [Aeromonas caviae]